MLSMHALESPLFLPVSSCNWWIRQNWYAV